MGTNQSEINILMAELVLCFTTFFFRIDVVCVFQIPVKYHYIQLFLVCD